MALEWNAKHRGTGMRYETVEGRVIVQRVRWTRPGFARPNIQASGWGIFVDGEQQGPAHPSATKARANAEQPGVWAEILKKLEPRR